MGLFSSKPKKPAVKRCFQKFDIKYENGKEVSAKRCTRPAGHGGTLFGDGHSNTRMT